LNFESISLFVERAKLANPSFALSEENARDISRICARLDGLPLAIELAAARMKILSPPIILSKLKDSLKLLTDGACDLPARQQTMRGAIEWSYDLLGEDEKSLFRQLSVFAGGSSLESAEEVCGSNDKAKEEQREVFEVLTSLVNKNLLFSKEHANGNVRFRMLGVVREYALEALEASGETQAMRRSHADYFLALGEEAEPHLRASKTVEWPNRLEEELDNFRSALRWSLANHPEIAARLISATRVFWILHNHLTEGSGWLEAALATSHNSSVAVRSKLRGALAHAALLQGDYETTQEMHEISLAEGELANDKQQIALATCGLGISAFHQGDYDKARKYYEEGLTMSRGLNNEFGIVQSLNVLGDLARIKGDNAKARELSGEALEISRKLGSKELVSASLNNMGAIVFAENDYDASCAYFTESMLMARELGYKIQLSYSLDGFAALAEKQGELQRATRLAGAAENLRDSIGSKIEPAEQYLRDTYLEKIRAAMDASLFSESYEEGRRMTLDRAIYAGIGGSVEKHYAAGFRKLRSLEQSSWPTASSGAEDNALDVKNFDV
jgi:tetratricopeptide (TPR) repeat protein